MTLLTDLEERRDASPTLTTLTGIQRFEYDARVYSFRTAMGKLLELPAHFELESLHCLPGAPKELVKTGKDNHTPWHDKIYARLGGSWFEQLYLHFINDVVKPRYNGEAIVYQRKPTFRIHWVGNLSVGAFHKDSDYNHPVEELNFWVPLTDARGNNSIWLESEPDKGDYQAQTVEHGNVLTFPGGQLRHGSKVNDTPHTRVSFDFRVIPASQFRDRPDLKGVAFGVPRTIGEYYATI